MGLFSIALALLPFLVALLVFQRLYVSPLRHIPGPMIAALSSWYSGYHDLIRGGQYVWVVEEMHKKYGPIVRVRPDVVHVSDPLFIEKLYTGSPKQRRERYWTVTRGLQAPGSMLASQDHSLHQRRRAVLNPYFSQQNVRRLEPVIHDTLEHMFQRFDGWANGPPVAMSRVFRAATNDVIQAYALGDGVKCLDMEDCNAAFFDVVVPGPICHLGTHVYPLAKLLANLPISLMLKLMPRVGVFANFMVDLNATIDAIRADEKTPENTTIFHEILRNKDLPASEKETLRVADEAMTIVIAGSETTAATLSVIVYHMLADAAALQRLKAELSTAMNDSTDSIPSLATLENLPYLNAVIEEAIRLYPGATHRQDRVAPDEDLVYHDPNTGTSVVIPAGTAIGMTAPISNRDPTFWGDRADEFLPERFFEKPQLRRHVLSFSKGTRQCLGMNLAYAELRMFVAGIFHRYDFLRRVVHLTGPFSAAVRDQSGGHRDACRLYHAGAVRRKSGAQSLLSRLISLNGFSWSF